jgi:hypothetical protein
MIKNNKIFLLLSILILTNILFSCNKDFHYKNKYPPVKIISYNEYGQNFSLEAISGQVIVIFNKSIPYSQAVKEIEQLKGIIIGQILNLHYYLIDTGVGNETDFLSRIKSNPNVKYAYFNAIEYPCKIDLQTYVLDNFYISHGENVSFALKECGLTTRLNTYNVGIEDDEKGRMSLSEIDRELISILSFPTKDTPLIINMSFGPEFIDPDIDYWTDEDITDEVKIYYIKQYKESLKHIVALTTEYKDKDFIIVKAAGNEGLKQLDIEILNDLGKELTDDEINILNEHFILVGAIDKRDTKYSNTVTKGNYNILYTSVDISDLKNNNKNLYGTSFAAPRVSCFAGTAVNENNIKATEVLKVIKDITRKNPDMALTQEIINKNVKMLSAKNNKETKPDTKMTKKENKNLNTDNTEISQSIKNFKDEKNLAGTIWQCQSKESVTLGIHKFIEFKNNGEVEINHVYANNIYSGLPLKEPYVETYNGTYYYEKKPLKKWVVKYNTNSVEHKAEIILQGNVLILGWLGTDITQNFKRIQ